ncbi:ribosome biogenesis regulatory protein homolog [Anabrus simplex]|uniref:ribosome biogenesis regulatory protein homolog n=1 Tax=Anabrus simplex TaxID=316456 RepID=UPI0034DD8240
MNEILEKIDNDGDKHRSTEVQKHLELEIDLGTLLAVDTNELDLKALRTSTNEYLKSLARDNTQILLNKIWDLPTERVDDVIVCKIPPPKYILPREQPVPGPKQLTKWQKYAQEKGITKSKKSKLAWDDILQKWVPKYGYKRAKAEKEKDWLLEVPKTADPLEDQFQKQADTKREKVAKNEFQRLRNIASSKNIKVPRAGLPSAEFLNATQLGAAVTVSKASTASLGKFQAQLPKEKPAKKIGALLPNSKKRKRPMLAPEKEKKSHLDILDGILKKKPKIDVEKAVNKQIYQEQQARSAEKEQQSHQRSRSGGKKKRSGPNKKGKGKGKGTTIRTGAKPKGGKGKRSQAGGRKRR